MKPHASPQHRGIRDGEVHFLSSALPIGTESKEAIEFRVKLEEIAAQSDAADPLSGEFRRDDRVRSLREGLLGSGFLPNEALADWFMAVCVTHLRSGGILGKQLDVFRRFLLRPRFAAEDGTLSPWLERAGELYPRLAPIALANAERRHIPGLWTKCRQLTELCQLCSFLSKGDACADDLIERFLNPLRGDRFRLYFHATLLYELNRRAPEVFEPEMRAPLYATMLFLQMLFWRWFGSHNSYLKRSAQAVTPDNDLGSRMTCLFDEIGALAREFSMRGEPDALFGVLCAGYLRMLEGKEFDPDRADRPWEPPFLFDVYARIIRGEADAAAHASRREYAVRH